MTEQPEMNPAEVDAAIKAGSAIVCYTKCWSCMLDASHYSPPRWHTWADDEDVEHAEKTGQPDPRRSRCGCPCANAEAPGGGS